MPMMAGASVRVTQSTSRSTELTRLHASLENGGEDVPRAAAGLLELQPA